MDSSFLRKNRALEIRMGRAEVKAPGISGGGGGIAMYLHYNVDNIGYTIPDSSEETIDYDTSSFEGGSGYSVDTSAGFVMTNTSGADAIYHVDAALTFQGNFDWANTTYVILRAHGDEAIVLNDDTGRTQGSGNDWERQVHGSGLVFVSAGGTLYITIYQDSGGSRDVLSSRFYNYVSIFQVA